MPAPAPRLTVVVVARDRAPILRLALESLERQTLPLREFEVVVVDDGSTDGTGEVASAFEARLPLRVARQGPAGVASARNHGLFLARAPLVLFLDEEVAEPELLARHAEAHRRFPEPRVAVLGRRSLDASLAQDPLMRLAAAGPLGWGEPGPAPGATLDWTFFRAGGASCKRKLLVEGGTFDAAFRTAGEDVELAARLARRGLEVVWEPGAATRFAAALSLDEVCLRAYERGRARARAARLHPGEGAAARLGTAGAEEAWRALAPAHDALVRSARAAERFARACAAHGLPLDDGDRELIRRSFAAALRASELRGLRDGAGGSGGA